MTRPTASTINDAQLDALYDRLARTRDAAALHRQGLLSSAGLYAVIEAAPMPNPPEQPAEHVYLSTGCFHGDHDYCKSMTGLNGAKRPASCKKCGAKCICPCHNDQTKEQP